MKFNGTLISQRLRGHAMNLKTRFTRCGHYSGVASEVAGQVLLYDLTGNLAA